MRGAIFLFCLHVVSAAGCADTGQREVVFPVHASGVEDPTFTSGAWTVTLDEARVGLGPLYFCATLGADMDLCATARAEWLGSASADGLDPTLQMLGEGRGVTGGIGSMMLDYGRTWLLTLPEPRANDGAPEGHSLVLRGRAVLVARTITFEAAVDIDAQGPGEAAIGGLRTQRELDGTEAFALRVDAVAWAARMDFDEVAALADATDHAVIDPGTPPHEDLALAMRTARLPAVEWIARP